MKGHILPINRGYCHIEIWILDITHWKGDIGVTEIWIAISSIKFILKSGYWDIRLNTPSLPSYRVIEERKAGYFYLHLIHGWSFLINTCLALTKWWSVRKIDQSLSQRAVFSVEMDKSGMLTQFQSGCPLACNTTATFTFCHHLWRKTDFF